MDKTKILIYLLATSLVASTVTNIYYYSNESEQVAAVKELKKIKDMLAKQALKQKNKEEAWKKLTAPGEDTNTNDGMNWSDIRF